LLQSIIIPSYHKSQIIGNMDCLQENSIKDNDKYIYIKASSLKQLHNQTKNLSTTLKAIKLDFDEMTMEYSQEFNLRMKEVNKILEKSKDFHLQHLVNICESTKSIIQIITNY